MTDSEHKIARAGTLLSVDGGVYSDYEVLGFFVVLRDFDPMLELAEHIAAHPEQSKEYCFKPEDFLSSLISKGLLLELAHGILFLGGYGKHDTVHFSASSQT